MNSSHRISSFKLFLAIGLVAVTTFSTTAFAQFHGGAILKTPVGPSGMAEARVGEIISATITVMNLDDFLDTITVTSLFDVVHHFSGDVTSPNLLPAPITIPSFFFDPFNSAVTVTHTYLVLPGDDGFADHLLKDDAIADGTDNHDGPGGTLMAQPFHLTFPGQVEILSMPGTNFCVLEAVSDSFNPGGSQHALWLPGISTNLIFTPEPGSWMEFPDGSAHLTGTVRSRTNLSSGFLVDVNLSGRTTVPPVPPKLDLDSNVYVPNGPVDPSTWYFYPTWSGTLTGFGVYAGAVLDIVRIGPAFQVGVGANGKNIHFGASAWFTWTVVQQRLSGPPLPDGQLPIHGDFNIDIFVCEPSALGDFVWADLNGNGLQDLGEPGVPGVEVRLTDCANTVLEVTQTDANGIYVFTNLVAGAFKVRVVPPAGAAFTARNVGANDNIDSDVTTNGYSGCISLGLLETNRTVDAGIVAAAPSPLPLRVLSLQPLSAGNMKLKIQGTLFRNYLIEGAEVLGQWKPLATVLNVNGTLQFRDPAQPSRCFYRVKSLP